MAQNPFDQFDAPASSSKSSNPFDQFDSLDSKPAAPAKRSAVGEILNQGKAGALVELPKMVGQAIQYTSDEGNAAFGVGKKIVDFANEQEQRPDLQADTANHGTVVNALAAGARMIPQSVAPAAAVGLGLAALPEAAIGAGTGLAISALAGSLPAGMSQAQTTLEKARAAGVNEEDALKAARINGAIESGGETVGTYLGGKLLGVGAKAIAGKKTAEGALESIAEPGVVKPWLKQIPETAIGEVGTEMLQSGSQQAVENAYGIDNGSVMDAATGVVAPTLGMTALLAPFGLAGFARNASQAQKKTEALSSAETSPEERQKIAADFYTQLNEIDPNAAAIFSTNAQNAILNNQPISVDANLFTPVNSAGTQEAAPQDAPIAPNPIATPTEPVDEFTQFTQQTDADIEARKVAAGIKPKAENIDAADILGESNVSNTDNATTGLATDATQSASDNLQGSVGDLPVQPNVSGLGNTTAAPSPSIGTDLPAGNASAPNNTVDRPFASAADDFLPKMRTMTTDEKVIGQIDAELALRGMADKNNKASTAPVTDAPKAESWVVRNKETGEPIMETFQKSVADKVDTSKYEAVPILQHLQELNQEESKASNYAKRDSLTKTTDSEANKDTVLVKKTAKTKATKAPKHKSLLTTLKEIGGIANSEKLDVTGEQKGFAPGGYNQIFKNSSTRSLKGLIESGDLDKYLPYNMRLEANGANDEAFDSTEAYDYLADKIRNGESVLPYAVEEELRALKYEGNAVSDVADELTEDEINEQLTQASNEERESATNARIFNTDSKDSGTESSAGREGAAQTNTSKQEEVKLQGSADLLGDNTAAKQSIADAERAKDTKRNSGNDNQESFTLTGSTSEADQAAAAGAQDLFEAQIKQQSITEASTGADIYENSANQSNNGQAKEAPNTRINGSIEREAAGRLEKLIDEIIKTNDMRFFSRNERETRAKGIIKNSIEELRKSKTSSDVIGLLNIASSDLMRQYPAFSQVIDDVITQIELKPAESKPANTQKAKDEARFANNKVFTADKVAAARARLKSKLNTLNSGIDPELLIDGMTIAGAYIETGVRKFSDYAKAMTEDFGDSIKPYLLSFYEAARAYPGINKDGMTDAESAATEHQALLTPAVLEQAKEVIGQGVVESPKAKAKPNGQIKLTQDWGVDNIDGWTESKDGANRETDFGLQDGIKDQFLAEGKKYLTQVSKLLEAEGWEAHKDKRGRTQKPVNVNEAGAAVSGEVTLTMRKGNAGVYVDLGTSSIRGLTGNHPQGVSVMIRATGNADTDQFATKGQNIWLSTDLSSTELANKLVQTAERYVKNTEQAEEGAKNARTTTAGQVPTGSTQSDLLAEQPGSGNSKPVDAGMAGTSESTSGQGRVSSGVSETSGNGTSGTSGSNRNESPSGSREASNAGNTGSTANSVNDFEITDETGIGEGGLAQKYKDNITAIKLIKTLESENRIATPEERNQLAKYNGFGALSKVFEKNNPKYQELKDLLTPEEYEAARASILNAYYTSPTIVKAMYDAVEHMGFKGGRILEPSLGSGNFFGMMPSSMRNKSKLNGVELDVITSRLAKYLYPNANIAVATGFEKYQAPQGYFDLVISNPPFGSEQLRDNEKADYSGFSIHNFFIAKSIDKLRDDGIMAVVVSHNFMDAMDTKAREWISKRANLIGGIRLPNTAFKDNAGTEVITDILLFQKSSTPEANPDWVTSKDHGDYFFNDYFSANPMNVLGRVEDITNQYGVTYTVAPTGDMNKLIKEFIQARLPSNVYKEPSKRIEVMDSSDSTVPDGVKVGTFYADDKGVVRQRLPDMLGAKRSTAWESPNSKAQERMLGMMALRDLLRNQMRLERDPMATEKEIERNRERMNMRYNEFLKKYGYLNSSTNRRIFLDDTESALLQALEIDYDQGVTATKAAATGMDEKPASAQKADIFSRRVLFPPSDSITVNNAKDALLASLNVKGIVDIDYMAEVYSKSANEIISELGDVVYNDPLKGYVTADEYLSGDVKTKLAEAKAKAKEDGKFNRNIEALEKVIPKDKLPSEIYASAGANWIPADVYADFSAEITGIPKDSLEFKYIPAAAVWLSEKTRGGDTGKMTSDFGTTDINAFDLFHLLINGKAPEVKETIGYGSDRRTVVNIEKTEAARSKYEKIKETWNSWIFKEATRADKLATIYNDKHNRIVSRKFDGSHMQFYGMSPAVTLRAHQKDVVWRAIQDRNVLLDHVVGAGKTMAMASIAMEMKRLGIARKPMFVVPNHLTLQWRSEFTKLYPASNILAATPEDFAKDKREKLFSKMVTGNYDAIIIGHSSLTKVGLPAEIEEKMYQEQVKELSDAIEAAKTERGDRGITRDMEKIKKNLEAKIDKLKEKAGVKDNVVSFDELGIDAMFVDEMHEFKNLFFTTQMQRTAGLGNPSGSGKALDLFMKIKFMTETYGEDVPLITATGTPVSNSLAEMYTMQRYMKYPEMKRQDLHLFDAWAKQFGEVENVYEVAPSGVGYRQSTRFSKFKNLPALMGSYTRFADIITMQDLKDQTAAQIDPQTGKPKVFPVPKLKSGRPINVIAQRSELQRDFFGVPQLAIDEKTGAIQFELEPENAIIEQNKDGKYLIIAQVKDENGDVIGRQSVGTIFDTKEDAELELVTKSLTPKTFIDPKSLLGQFANLAQLTRESNGKINALSLTGLANKSGLDYRIIDPSAPDFAGSKINQSVTNMVNLWKETAKDKGTQIVFCDLSIPNSARNDMGSKERRIYVRDRDGELTHKAKGTVFAPEGYEGFPFYITKGRNGFDVYEAVTGTLVRDYGIADKSAAKSWAANYVESESNRDRIFALRDTKTIDQSDIDEYRDAKELELADDGSNEISTADLEAVAGSSKFSVYDDIRAKLIKAGVPENQIAFIHDYNTPKQKEELFKRVNNGDVRFLFGSTPKLGAGTNVQKRLVGLHHIDAPWRPSDLEQREGRIIRQGNELYARDPDNFEIYIWRYATEQTYDTRRWQLLEHKAAGIEQLRKYTGEAEIEDVASEASNSADMKAAASGNPLILEETKLRTEVKRLINLEKAHADSQYAMARKVRDNTDYINNYLPKKIAGYQRMQDSANSYPVPEDKNKVASMKVDGKVVTSRESAENAIADLALKVRSAFTMSDEAKTIQYRGVDFTMERGVSLNSLMLRSPDGLMHTYGEKEGVSPSGLITRFNNYLDSFSARIEDANKAISNAKLENESLSSRLNEPFEFSDKLKQAQAEHANVQRRLMKSSQLESVPENQRPEFDRLVKARKETLKKLGLEKALKESEADAPVFSRGNGFKSSIPKSLIQDAVNNLRSKWTNAPEIIVVDDMNDAAIPKAVRDENERQLSQGAQGQPEAFFTNGKVYIVASEMNSATDVIRVVFHETLGHYGLRGLYGKELGNILNQVAMLRPREMKAKAKQYGLDLTKESDKNIAAEEILAEMAQTAPNSSFVKRAIAAIRQFLRDIGVNLALTDNDIIANYLVPARNYVVKGTQQERGVKGLVAAFNRDYSPSTEQLFKELTLNDDMFKYGKSDSKDLQQVFDDVVPELVKVEKSNIKDDDIQEFYNIYPIDNSGNVKRNQPGQIMVYKDGKVEINVLQWDEGYGGSGVYSALGNWAYNNSKVFAGDREGITPVGKLRRLENMISLALKFGTTDHIAPHPEQMEELNFDWREGDTEYNLGQMLEASYNAIRNGVYVTENEGTKYELTYKSPDSLGVAKLDDLVYDFDKQQFIELSNGTNFTDKDFESLASTKAGRATHAGSTTLKRAAIAHTFIRTQGTERQRLLELVSKLTFQRLDNTQLSKVFYSRSTPQSRLTPQWETLPESKLGDNLTYALQDKNIDLKRVSQAIKQAGVDIADRWNAYLQEELFHGRTAKRTQDFIKHDLEPLIEDMRMRGVKMADFEEYLWARHAEERNIQIAKINANMPDGGSGMKTQDARDYLAQLSPADKTKYEALARRIDLINRKSRQVLIDYGLESADTIAAWEGAYQHYVPLMREDMDAGFGNGTGQGFSVKGNASKRATGSNRAVVDIIANMAQQFEKNIIRGEKNRVSTALIGLAKLNPNENFWEVDTPPTIKTIVKGGTVYDVLYNGTKAAEFSNKNAALNYINAKGITGYAVNERQSPDHVEYVTDPNYKNRDNVIVARIKNRLGKVEERSVVFNQFDERAMRMAASLKNLDQDQIGELLGMASGITRYFAAVNTQYNPIFGIVNITRDVQGALLNLSTTPIANKKGEVLGQTISALKGIYSDLRSQRKNGTQANNQWAQLFEEFQNEGGQTGYRDMYRNAKERSEAIKNALDPLWWQNSKIGKIVSLNGIIANQEQWVFDKAIKPIFEWLEDYNNALENAVRLSVYKVALDSGHSKQQAASMAKNISVNFNRKGEMGRQIGSLYAFFNASVQGTARIAETLTSRDSSGNIRLSNVGKRIVQGGLLLGAMQAVALAAVGYGNDEPPEFVRDRSIIIPLGDSYITIPMPLGYNAIPSFGRILTEWALSGGKNTQERLVHIMDMLLDVTNPIGNAGISLQTIAPTVIDPLAALAENKDFTGRPIARQDFNSLDPTPGFTRAKDTASAIAKGLAYAINGITGGTDFKPGAISPTPDQIDYLIGQVTGGVGREAMKVEQTATSIATGENLPAYKIPVVGRFYGDTTGQSSEGNAFYKNLREIKMHENQIKGMERAGEDARQYRLDNPESTLVTVANYTERTVQKLRKQRRAMLEKDAQPEQIQKIDARITELMHNLNQKVKQKQES